jgi:hypothetical protein
MPNEMPYKIRMRIAEDVIRRRSYEIWQREGCPEGDDWAHWFQAEAELENEDGPSLPPGPVCGHPGAVAPRPIISLPPHKFSSRPTLV